MKKEKVKILISGWYGHGNIGDEAILQGMIDTFGEELGAKVTAFSDRPFYTEKHHQIRAFRQIPLNIKLLIKGILDKSFLKSIKAIKECDVFIMGGGGFLSDWTPSVPFSWLKQFYLAKKYRKKTMLYGIGAGPFRTKKGMFWMKFFINNYVDTVTTRDKKSKEWLLKCGVDSKKITVTGDQAIKMKNKYSNDLININFDKSKKNIGFIITPYLKGKDNKKYIELKNIFEKALKKLSEDKKRKIYLIPFQDNIDYMYCKEIIKELNFPRNIELLSIPGDHMLTKNILANLDYVVSLRLHGNILAALTNTPFIPIVYHHKTYEFCKRLGWDYNLQYGDGFNWDKSTFDENELISMMETFEGENKDLRRELLEKFKKYSEKERKNIEELRKIL